MGSAQEILKQILPTDENNIHCKLLLRSWSYILHNMTPAIKFKIKLFKYYGTLKLCSLV